jgi:hypothetical protein
LSAVLACAGFVLIAGVLALIPLMIAWSRRHRQSDAILALALLWGLLLALSAGATTLAKMKYSHEHLVAIESGYSDPLDTSDAPPLPWLSWAGLGLGYGALLAWALLGPTSSERSSSRTC